MNMVKKLAIATAFLFAATVANAEDGMKFGLRVGYSMQMLSKGDADKAPDMGMLGVGGGLVANIPAGPIVIAPGVAFVYRTLMNDEDSYGNVKVEYSIREMAVSIPVVLKFFPVEGFFLQAGVQFDIPIGTETCATVDDKEECKDIDDRSSVDIGIPLGLGYMVTPNFGIDFRYVLGLSKVADVSYDPGSLSSIGLGLTYLF
jgi:type III secretory pathway component EscV